ncbi:MAG: GerMN domain-containing protein [Desulfuromonadales bacterium]|nr:GerMN domain-containing protein [Desulfuromonadales bacterium]
MAPNRRRKMNISLLIPFAIVAMVFGGLIWKKMQNSRELRPIPQVNQPAAARKGVLFFVADGTRLAREARELDSCGDTAECVKDLLDELFSGPVGDLNEALPEAAAVSGVRLEGDLAVVDLTRPFVSDMPVGSSAEMLAVYSIVNTVCVNYPQIARVRITVEGDAKANLNHLELSEPLVPDYSLEQEPAATKSAVPATSPAAAAKKGHP